MSTFERDSSAPPELDDIGVNLPAPADFSTALAEGFARRIGTLARRGGASGEAVKWAARAAFATSRATAEGHVCLPLAVLARRFDASSADVRAALFASGMASDGSPSAAALRPLVIDGQGRLYLARYYDYERRLARSLVMHAGGGQVEGVRAREHARAAADTDARASVSSGAGGAPDSQTDAGEGEMLAPARLHARVQMQVPVLAWTLPCKRCTRVCCATSGRRRTTRSTGNVSRQSWRCPGG